MADSTENATTDTEMEVEDRRHLILLERWKRICDPNPNRPPPMVRSYAGMSADQNRRRTLSEMEASFKSLHQSGYTDPSYWHTVYEHVRNDASEDFISFCQKAFE